MHHVENFYSYDEVTYHRRGFTPVLRQSDDPLSDSVLLHQGNERCT